MIAADQPFDSAPGEPLRSDDGSLRVPRSDLHYLYPHAWHSAGQPAVDPSPRPPAGPAAELPSQLSGSDADHVSMQAVIGDELRIPAVWCQLGNCISRLSDSAALGEADIRSRAVAIGWRQDALGRLACPGCVQHDPTFRISYPVVPWSAQLARPAAPLPSEPLPEVAEPTEPTEHAEAVDAIEATEAAEAADLTWASKPLPFAMTGDEAEPRPGRFWHREAGRHRLTI